MPNYGYYPSPFSGAEVDAAVSAYVALPGSGAIVDAISSATSGALSSGAEIQTQVGDYLLTYTSGGFVVSGSGAELKISGGTINATISEGGSVVINNGGVTLDDGIGGTVNVLAGGMFVSGVAEVNQHSILTELAVSSNTADDSISFNPLSGGTSYIYTLPVSAVTLTSITDDCRAQLTFTALSANIPVTVPVSVNYIGNSQFDSDGKYIIAVNYPELVCVPYTETT